jgi:hypothetical protein
VHQQEEGQRDERSAPRDPLPRVAEDEHHDPDQRAVHRGVPAGLGAQGGGEALPLGLHQAQRLGGVVEAGVLGHRDLTFRCRK